LAVTPWNVTATLPAKRFPLAFFGTRHLQATRSSTNAPLPTRDVPPTFAAHLIVPNLQRDLEVAPLDGHGGDQRRQRSSSSLAARTQGLSPSFFQKPENQGPNAREKALGCASVQE
jgi:hypothetical protein